MGKLRLKAPDIYNLINKYFIFSSFVVCIVLKIKINTWELPGGPGVRALYFHCQGLSFNPWLGN